MEGPPPPPTEAALPPNKKLGPFAMKSSIIDRTVRFGHSWSEDCEWRTGGRTGEREPLHHESMYAQGEIGEGEREGKSGERARRRAILGESG